MIEPVWLFPAISGGVLLGYTLFDLKSAYKARNNKAQKPKSFCGSRYKAQYGLGAQQFSKLVRCEEYPEHRGLHSAELGRSGTLETMCLTWVDEESLDWDETIGLDEVPDVFAEAWGPKAEDNNEGAV